MYSRRVSVIVAMDMSNPIEWRIITPKDNALVFEGFARGEASRDNVVKLAIIDDSVEILCETFEKSEGTITSEKGELVTVPRTRIKVSIPIGVGSNIRFGLRDNANQLMISAPRFGKFSHLNHSLPFSYFVNKNYIIENIRGVIRIKQRSIAQHYLCEAKYLSELLVRRKFPHVLYRIIYYMVKPFVRKPIWIIGDRPHVAGDNGEHFYRHLVTHNIPSNTRVYFLIDPTSKDFARIDSIGGHVLRYGSVKHRILFLHSEIIVCSAANELATNAFGKKRKYYQDLYAFNFVYIRHGVSHNDQSSWLNRLNKNIALQTATTLREKQGITQGNYQYDSSQVALTGLARLDGLQNIPEKHIAIMPTWRKNLEGEMVPRSSKRAYRNDFKNSQYCKFYNELLHNQRLLQSMESHGYSGALYIHPVFEAQVEDFQGNEILKISRGIADYQSVFCKSAIMVTDYSSVAFDFAYLKKPLIYAQFDRESFYENHSWGKGYFDYDQDSFGDILGNVEEVVDKLIWYMTGSCEMEEKYKSRVSSFFAFDDRQNCKRIYEAIKRMKDSSQ